MTENIPEANLTGLLNEAKTGPKIEHLQSVDGRTGTVFFNCNPDGRIVELGDVSPREGKYTGQFVFSIGKIGAPFPPIDRWELARGAPPTARVNITETVIAYHAKAAEYLY